MEPKHQFIKLNLRKGQFSKNQETLIKLPEPTKEVPYVFTIKEKQLQNPQSLVHFCFLCHLDFYKAKHLCPL